MAHALRQHWPLLAIIVVECVLLRAWLHNGDLMGSDWIRRTPEELATFYPWPHVWNGAQQMGENTSVYMTSFPLFAFMGLLSRLHLAWTTIERLCYFFPYLILGAVAPYALTYRLTRNAAAAAIGALYFCFNPWMVQSIERGAVPSIVAAAIIPLAILQLLRLLEKPGAGRAAALAWIIFAIVLYDIRYALIASMMLVVIACEELIRRRSAAYAGRILVQALVASSTLAILNLYWIIPQLFAAANPGAGYGSLEDYRRVSGGFSAAHGLTNFEPYYHWVASNPAFDRLPPDAPFFIVPILVLIAFSVSSRRRYAPSFALIAFAAAVLSSGGSGPFEQLDTFVYTHVPFMPLFRDVNKWMSATTLSYAVLLAFGASRLCAFIRMSARAGAAGVSRLAFGAAVVLYVCLMNDAFNPIRYRLFATYTVAQDTRDLERFLNAQTVYARTLVFPRDVESMRASETHPYVEAQSLFLNPMYGGARFLNYDITSTTAPYENPLTPNLLREINIRYIVVPYDDDKIVYKPQLGGIEFGDAVSFIAHQPYARFVRKFGRNYVFELKKPMLARGFVAPMPFVFNGSGISLAAVAPTILWNSRAAAIFVDQPLPHAIDLFARGYVEAPFAADTNLTNAQTISKLRAASAHYREYGRRGHGMRGIAATTASSTTLIYTSLSSSTLDATFQPGLVRFPQALYSVLTAPSPQFNHTFSVHTQMREVKTAGIVLRGASWSDEVGISTKPVPGGVELRIYNPNMQTALGTLLIQDVRFAGSAPVHVRCLCTGDSPSAETINPKQGAATVVLRNVTIAPGTTVERLETTGLEHARFPVKGSFVASERNPQIPGTLLAVPLDREGVSLAESPSLRIAAYRSARSLIPSLLLTFESLSGAPKLTFERKLGETDRLTPIDLRDFVGKYLKTHFAAELNEHAGDAFWLRDHRLRDEPDGAGAYRLTAVDAVAVSASGDAPADTRISIEGGITRNASSTGDDLSVANAPSMSGAKFASLSASGMRVVRINRTGTLVRVTARKQKGTGQLRMYYRLADSLATPLLSLTFFAPDRYTARVRFTSATRSLEFNEAVLARPAKHGIRPGLWPLMTSRPNVRTFANVLRCLPDTCTGPEKLQPAWRRFILDTSVLEDREAAIVRSARSVEIIFDRSGRPAEEDTLEFAAILAPNRRPSPHAALDGMTVDGNAPLVQALTRSGIEPYLGVRGSTRLNQSANDRIQTAPVEPYQPKTALVASGIPQRLPREETLTNVRPLSPAELEGRIRTSGGIFVFTESYDSAWQLAMLAPGESASGWALADYIRFHDLFAQDHAHIAINDLVNGWALPRGSHHLLLLVSSQAFSELGALVTLCLTPIWMIVLLVWPRRLKAESAVSPSPPESSSFSA